MNSLHLRWLILIALAMPAAAAPLQDAPAPDLAAIRDFLTKLQAEQEAAVKRRRATAFDTVKVAATNGEKAVALWKEAVKAVMFEGAEDEANKVRAWREADGDALNSKEAQTAAKLHLTWLFFTLQHHAGVKTKDLVPFVIEYTAQLAADGQTMDTFEENLEKTREREASGKHGVRKNDDARVKVVHDAILNTPVTSSPVAKYLGLEDILPRAASQNDRTAKAVAKLLGTGTPTTSEETWPLTPGDLDGIHRAIILPEYRAARDSRLIEYLGWRHPSRGRDRRQAQGQLRGDPVQSDPQAGVGLAARAGSSGDRPAQPRNPRHGRGAQGQHPSSASRGLGEGVGGRARHASNDQGTGCTCDSPDTAGVVRGAAGQWDSASSPLRRRRR